MSNERNNKSGLETQFFKSSSMIGHINLGGEKKHGESSHVTNGTSSDRSTGTLSDIGFGEKVLDISKRRMINRDGSFNVKRKGYSFIRSRSLYPY